MQSASTIPSTEINVNDKNVNAEYLRPNSATSRIVFHEKNAQRKYKCLVLRRDESYVAK
jgi:hypothetical protein